MLWHTSKYVRSAHMTLFKIMVYKLLEKERKGKEKEIKNIRYLRKKKKVRRNQNKV